MRGRRAWAWAQGVVTLVLLGTLLRGLDVNAFRNLFARLPLWFYVLSMAVVLAGQVGYAWRWQRLLRATGVHAPFATVLRQYFIGIFLNNFLPSTVGGDVAKVYLLGKGHGYRRVTASVLLDRGLGIALLAALASVTLWLVPLPFPVLVTARVAVTVIAVVALAVLVVLTVGTGGLDVRVSRLGVRAIDLARRLQRLRGDMAGALTSPAVIAQAGAVVIAYFAALSWVCALFIGMQAGGSPSWAMLSGIVMATSVLSNIPVSLNGIGLREQLHVALLAPLGVGRETAVAISLLLFGHLLVASLVGLGFWLQVRPTGQLGADQPS